MGLFTLVYVSYSPQTFTDNELIDLLKAAREKNDKLGITGMLLYRKGFFLQVLEGEQEKVQALYARIRQDPRHQRIITVYEAPIQVRSFGSWQMGFNKLDETVIPDGVEGYVDFLRNPTIEYLSKSSRLTMTLLKSFANQSTL